MESGKNLPGIGVLKPNAVSTWRHHRPIYWNGSWLPTAPASLLKQLLVASLPRGQAAAGAGAGAGEGLQGGGVSVQGAALLELGFP